MATLAPLARLTSTRGMVSAMDHLAAGTGVQLLRAGGSAADAAVGASAVLAVTAPHMCGLGGDLLAVVHPGGRERPIAMNASGRAGSGADAAPLRAAGCSWIPHVGDTRAATVPGCVDGWLALHERFGRLPLADVLAPARHYALEGFPLSPTLAAALAAVADQPEGAAVAEAHREVRAGTLRLPGIGYVLDEVIRHGRDGFYHGAPGHALLALGAGEYSPRDLDGALAEWVEPIAAEAWGRWIWTVPPSSQGYLVPTSAWIASRAGIPPEPESPMWAHLLVESARQAGHDRIEVLHEGADAEGLLAPARLEPRLAAIQPSRASALSGSYGSGDTVGLVSVDGDRMGVSLLQSLASAWGSMLVLGETGIVLHNRGVGFDLREGHPAEYAPGRRPPHTLSPVVVTGPDGSLEAALATMGGDAQPQVLLQILDRLFHCDEAPAEALAAGRWALGGPAGTTGFHTWAGQGLVRVGVEGNAPPSWAPGLVARGHDVVVTAPFDHGFGHAHAVVVRESLLEGAADPRSGGGGVSAW